MRKPAAAVPRTTAAGRLAVVGSGIAGLYAALLAAEAGLTVTLLSKGALEASNTHCAQGGITAVLAAGEAAPGDSVAAHLADTLRAGAGLSDAAAARVLCEGAAVDIAGLERFGVAFDREPDGTRALGLEAAHSAARILHAGGDATGAGIADALIRAVRATEGAGRIRVLAGAFVTSLTTAAGRVTGLEYLQDGGCQHLAADAVLLATGGAGQLFEHTTNPAGATADGVALAWRAGAVVADAEFFQFHPTALAVPGDFMISEAVRGEGAVLRDADGVRFMPAYHPDAELAPRDVVSRAIAAHLRARGAEPEETVFLDATGIEQQRGPGFLARRFPTIAANTARHGFDWTTGWLPVIPAAHYWMGGVATDLSGRTSLPGLYAAGEVSCTGVHGANRLASNSLLEGLVFSRRAVADVLDGGGPAAAFPAAAVDFAPANGAGEDFGRAELARMLSRHAGVVRERQGLAVAAKQLAAWSATGTDADARQRDNLLTAARIMVHAAAHRQNSAGAHYRSDCPEPPSTTTHNYWRRAGAPAESPTT